MRLPRLGVCLFLLSLAVACVWAAPNSPHIVYDQSVARFEIATLACEWRDPTRDRVVPAKIYYPISVGSVCPVIIFSHGLGGSRDGYRYLGEYWARHGYVSVHVQHAGSDTAAIIGFRVKHNFEKAATNVQAARDRPADISFAIDCLTAMNVDPHSPLHGRLDLARLGVAGHSYGAFTAMAVAGAHFPVLGNNPGLPDPRVKAAIAMSTPADDAVDNDTVFDAVKIPVFHLTGTKDGVEVAEGRKDAFLGQTKPSDRRRPYDHTQHATAYLLTFDGGDHMVFSGRLTAKRPTDALFQARVCEGSTAFWDAYLKGDSAARTWLEAGTGFTTVLGQSGVFEQKHPSNPP